MAAAITSLPFVNKKLRVISVATQYCVESRESEPAKFHCKVNELKFLEKNVGAGA